MSGVSRDAKTCSDWTRADWDKYIDLDLIKDVDDPYILDRLNDLKATCPKNIADNQIDKCLDRISGYFKQITSHPGNLYSGIMTDEAYLASQPPESVALPPELAGAPHALPANWREIMKKNNWKYVLFHSDTGNESRLIVFIPGKTTDKTLLYYRGGRQPTNDPTTYSGVQIQSIVKQVDGKDLENPKYFFKAWNFDGPNKTVKVRMHAAGRCVSCHTGGPRAIVLRRDPGFSPEFGGVSNVDQFNRLMSQRRILDYSPYFDPKYFPTQVKVGEKWGCTDCHDGRRRNTLAYLVDSYGGFAYFNLHRKVVDEKSMPPGHSDAPNPEDARTKASVEISRDFNTQIRNWLTENKCSEHDDKFPFPRILRKVFPTSN